jgi:hypothetical protein
MRLSRQDARCERLIAYCAHRIEKAPTPAGKRLAERAMRHYQAKLSPDYLREKEAARLRRVSAE